MQKAENEKRIELAKKSLLGVSVGDSFGESFFGKEDMQHKIANKELPTTNWSFTDDTVMSIAIFEELESSGEIDQHSLIKKFIRNHDADPFRGYGATLRRLLREVSEGKHWETAAKEVFDGQGSMGNGAAMRVCPIGAYYYDDIKMVKKQAVKSAEVTHANNEAICGAMAVSIATALAAKVKIENVLIDANDFISLVVKELPASDTTSRIAKGLTLPQNAHTGTLISLLGNGTNMTAQDTVPFVIWCSAYHLHSFSDALWKGVSVLGDRDTICAMIGGITILSSIKENIPPEWVSNVEAVDNSIFRSKPSN